MNFISFKDTDQEEPVMHSNSDNIDIMVYDKADELLSNVLNDIKFACKKQ